MDMTLLNFISRYVDERKVLAQGGRIRISFSWLMVMAISGLLIRGQASGASSADYSILPDVFDGGAAFSTNADFTVIGCFEPGFMGTASSGAYNAGHGFIPQLTRVISSVAGQMLFYNNSVWDGGPQADASDDLAVAPDKSALVGGKASFANYSSYSRGINGVMIDILNLPGANLSLSDVEIRIGNNSTPSSWVAAPVPTTILVRRGAGIQGADRVSLVWPDGSAPRKAWLRVKVLPTANTGLLRPTIFYFGNAIGEAGNSGNDARVSTVDELLARNNPASVLNPAAITNRYDFNRDRRVSSVDQLIARNNSSSVLNELRLITVTDGYIDRF